MIFSKTAEKSRETFSKTRQTSKIDLFTETVFLKNLVLRCLTGF